MNKRTFVEPKIYKSKDGQFLEIVLPGDLMVRKHVNYFKSILGVEFTAKVKPETTEKVTVPKTGVAA